MNKDQKMLDWMKAGVALAKEKNYTPQMMGWIACSAVFIAQEEEIPPRTDDFEAQKAFAAIKILDDYLDNECDFMNCTEWRDKKGYYFVTDLGYFFEGLENMDGSLIKRLKKPS